MDEKMIKKVEAFFSKYRKVHYGKRDFILQPGEKIPGIMYLKNGLVRQYVLSKKGDVMVVHIFRPGAFFLMMWAINNTPNSYYFEAITPVEVWVAPLKDVKEFVKKDPEILYDFTSRILKGLDGVLKRFENLTFDPAYSKVASLLSYFARQFGKKKGNGTQIEYPLTHREVASWIGTARETASLQMEDLKRRGIITFKGRSIIVRDMKKLEKEAATAEFL